MYTIFPCVKKQVENDLKFSAERIVVNFPKKMENIALEMQTFLVFDFGVKEDSNILFIVDKNLEDEAYELSVREKISIKAKDERGFYYATKTLKQIFENQDLKEGIEGVDIYDKPDLKIRGFMFDISRGKVAKLETLKYIVDIMSDLKMNHFELYVEGFSFEYESFPQYLEKDCYITRREYKKLEKYCNNHYIDLVPNQNGFGHMTEWLDKEEFKDLAEMPGGIHMWGVDRKPSTLDPNNPKSLELIKKLYDDMLPLSNSKYFNMNFDEPFELGEGKSKEECERRSVNDVYIDFVNKVVPFIYEHKKYPLIWGDVLVRHKANLERMPKDIIYIDWGYDATYPFAKNLKLLRDNNVQFMAAPGTTTWCGWLGRIFDWTENINSAIWNTYKLGGLGVLLTDWGDFGHPQLLPPTLPPLVFAGLLSYRCKSGTLKDVRTYLNKYVFKDKNNLFADVLIDAGGYYQYENEYRGNGTTAFATWYKILGSLQKEDPFARLDVMMIHCHTNEAKGKALLEFIDCKRKQLKLCDVDKLWIDEVTHTLGLVEAWTYVNLGVNINLDISKRVKYLEKGIKGLNKSKKDLKKVWMARNKKSHLDGTIALYDQAIDFLNSYLVKIQGGLNEE